jgi:ribosomal protein S18 acetylase RimI-like enzyme
MTAAVGSIVIRSMSTRDFDGVVALTREVYPASPPWSERQLVSHLKVFPEGQLVAVETATQRVVGMAASLIVLWDDYDTRASWRDFTDGGMFTNHDPVRGRTLYGAEVMVLPGLQGRGIGSALYCARRASVERLGLLRIRAGARLRGYHRYAARESAEEYVARVVAGARTDPTLTFQLRHGFHVLAVAEDYLHHDPESQGFAAVIEWINRLVARPEDYPAGGYQPGQDPAHLGRRRRQRPHAAR